MCPSDQDCINQCLNGHPDEFRQLVLRYERPIMSYLASRLGDNEAAAEVAQESFVRAYFRLGTLRRGDAFFAWLMGIAQRVMLESFRRRQRTTSLSEAADPVAPPAATDTDSDTRLAEAVAALPDIYREVTVLRYFGGLSCADVSGRLGVPLGTVTKRLSRAYGLLRETLSRPDDQRREVQP
jgi:RNA polymerase sigma factor (sigma-70 family)